MFDEEERLVYEIRMQSLADIESKIASAEEIGLERGREQGIHKASKAIALNMLAKGINITTIAEVTGLTENIIQQLGAR
jgi:predicted transposase/invertase (TIGR01784 family)